MCGRFVQTFTYDTLFKDYHILKAPAQLLPNFNVAPSQQLYAIRHHQKTFNRIFQCQWGLVPYWAKDPRMGASLINARAETLTEKPSFKYAYKKRRCLIPADGFYEWKLEGRRKQPYFISYPSHSYVCFAGLWETWTEKNGTKHHTCVIITQAASQSMQPFHHRMPVVIDLADSPHWLSPSVTLDTDLRKCIEKNQAMTVKGYPVSPAVNRSTTNRPGLLKPL